MATGPGAESGGAECPFPGFEPAVSRVWTKFFWSVFSAAREEWSGVEFELLLGLAFEWSGEEFFAGVAAKGGVTEAAADVGSGFECNFVLETSGVEQLAVETADASPGAVEALACTGRASANNGLTAGNFCVAAKRGAPTDEIRESPLETAAPIFWGSGLVPDLEGVGMFSTGEPLIWAACCRSGITENTFSTGATGSAVGSTTVASTPG
jgi:hypothetical protein